jgi:hypothetical protein
VAARPNLLTDEPVRHRRLSGLEGAHRGVGSTPAEPRTRGGLRWGTATCRSRARRSGPGRTRTPIPGIVRSGPQLRGEPGPGPARSPRPTRRSWS